MKALSSTAVSTDVVLRGLAISWVVFNHAHKENEFTGGMSLLMLLSGLNLARFGLKGRFVGEARDALRTLALRLLGPGLLLVVLSQIAERQFNLQETLFVRNWLTHERLSHFPVWYVQVMVQMLVLIYLLFCLPRLGRAFLERPLVASLALTLVALAVRFAFPIWWDTSHLTHHLPHLYLWLFVLGWFASFVIDRAQSHPSFVPKIAVLVLAATGAVIAFPTQLMTFWWLVVGSALLLWVERITLPTIVARVTLVVSQATFGVFLLHREMINVYRNRVGPSWTGGVDCWLFAMVGSIAVWFVAASIWRAFRALARESALANAAAGEPRLEQAL